MRKRFRRKLRSCAMCKPHKIGWESRWSPSEAARLRDDERQILDSTRTTERR